MDSSFFVSRIFKTREEYLSNSPVEGTVHSMEQKFRVFILIDVQEFHLWARGGGAWTFKVIVQ
jgi:hypothetical protein